MTFEFDKIRSFGGTVTWSGEGQTVTMWSAGLPSYDDGVFVLARSIEAEARRYEPRPFPSWVWKVCGVLVWAALWWFVARSM